jgi:FkbM family methyltransferase
MNITIDNHLGTYIIPKECGNKVCVDVGSNTGNFIQTQLNNFELFHFYEPYKPCFEIIKNKFSDNHKVVGFNEAVYHTSDLVLELFAHDNHDSGSNGLKTDCLNEDWVEKICDVNTVSLETILSRVGGHIDYLKVDCENSEYHLFMDKDLNNIDFIGIEMHHHMGKEKYDNLINHIKKTHFTRDNCSWTSGNNYELLFMKKR